MSDPNIEGHPIRPLRAHVGKHEHVHIPPPGFPDLLDAWDAPNDLPSDREKPARGLSDRAVVVLIVLGVVSALAAAAVLCLTRGH